MQCSIESDFEDENEICYTSKGRAGPPVPTSIHPSYDEDSFPSSSWANTNEFDDDQASSSMDYYANDDEIIDRLFQIPSSSTDLRVSARQALHLASIYEFLRHFSPILRLTPFLFEHFCTAMIDSSHLNNKLFSEIHLSLLRLFIKQDDDDGITYASETDIKGIVDLSFVTMDYFTWPYILQLFVHSHPQLKFFASIVKNYPFQVNLDEKIELLQSLCDVALTTKMIRREFDDTKPKQHDDNCRKCQKRGDLLCCDRCEATFHLTCLDPPLTCVPTVQWYCPVCIQNEVIGVTDCIPLREHRPYYLRHRCIGHDREQRRYWFICRRLFVEDEFGDDVRYYSTIEEFDQLLSSLDERGAERLLVYRLQKRYNDIARAMQLTIDLHARVKPMEDSLMIFTDGSTPQHYLHQTMTITRQDYQTIVNMIQWPMQINNFDQLPGQIDGIYDHDDEEFDEKCQKSLVKKREFFLHSKLNTYRELMPMKQIKSETSWEEHLRHQHRIVAEVNVPIYRLNENEIDPSIWRRYEHYQNLNRYPRSSRGAAAYPRSNYYRDYYTGNNYEDEDGMTLGNEYDDFVEDFREQEEQCDTLFRKYDYRGTSRGRPRGRGRPPLYGRTNGRTSNSGHPPRGVNHLTTGSSYLTHQRIQNPTTTTTKSNEVPQPKNKRKPVKAKTVAVPSVSEEKSKRPGKILRSGRISRKPRRDSETDFGSENSDDSGAKDKGSATENEDEEFQCVANKDREGSTSSSTQSLTNFAAFAQNQLLNTGLIKSVDDEQTHSNDDDDEIDDLDEKFYDESTYHQTMLTLLDSTHPNRCELNFDRTDDNSYLHYENVYQTNPLATRKQMLLHERDRRAHLARKFSINHSPSFAWISPERSINGNYTLQQISDVLRLTLVHFECQIPFPFMHSRWRNHRLEWAKELLDLDRDLSLNEFIEHFLQFEASIKPVAFFDLYLDQVGYLKFRRATEKERDEAKKEEKDALIRRKIEADSIVQNVRFTRPLKHSVHRQRGEEYRLTGGQGWTFIRSTRRKIPLNISTKKFDWDSLSNTREKRSTKKNPHQLPVPWTFTFRSSQPANIFILPSHILRRLARNSMNLIDAPGFLNARLTGIGTRFGWPYPCGRPSIRTAWCYKVQTSSSFFAVAHHLKYLWFCLRWDLLTEKIHLSDETSINTHVDHDGICTRTQILAKRDSGPFDAFCEYFVRKTISSQSQENNPFNTIPISKSRSRALPQPSNSRLIITEQWLPERQLQPNQIKLYYRSLQEKYLKRMNKEKKQSAKPFIVRISPMNNETTNRSFSVVKLADGQIILVPTNSTDNLDRRLRLIAPTPTLSTQIIKAKTIRKVNTSSSQEPSAEDLARTKICENLLRTMVIKVERDLMIKSRNFFNERVEDLRKEFVQQRLRRRSDQVRQNVKKLKGRTSTNNVEQIQCQCEEKDLRDEQNLLQCQLCLKSFHRRCFDFKGKSNEFTCQSCRILTEKSQERLFCLCQSSYDESKFYIGCDVCADWLHGTCVNITPEQAEKFDVYLCPKCSTEKTKKIVYQSIHRKQKDQLLKLIEQLRSHQMSWPFQKSVENKAIKDPMDLTTLRNKLLNSKYRTLCDFILDVNKIFNNCRQFNPINSTLSQCANVLDTYFRQLLERLMNGDEQ